jgi:DNA replication protein DnaC
MEQENIGVDSEVKVALINRLKTLYESSPQKLHFVAIAGVPGSGKTTLATLIANEFNKTMGNELALALPMDGSNF